MNGRAEPEDKQPEETPRARRAEPDGHGPDEGGHQHARREARCMHSGREPDGHGPPPDPNGVHAAISGMSSGMRSLDPNGVHAAISGMSSGMRSLDPNVVPSSSRESQGVGAPGGKLGGGAGWVAAAQPRIGNASYRADRVASHDASRELAGLGASAGMGAGAGGADACQLAEEEAKEEEAARKEWLQYYVQTGQWVKAEELVVTDEEREDLEYLVAKERRERPPALPAWVSTGKQP